MSIGSEIGNVVGSVVGGVVEGVGATSDHEATEYEVDQGSFTDPNAEENRRQLQQLADEAAARQAPSAEAASATAAQIGQVDPITGVQLAPVAGAKGVNVSPAGQVGPVAPGQRTQFGTAPTAAGVTVGSAARIAQQPQAQFRAGQQQLVSQLANTIAGQTPSVAELQLRRGSEQNVRNQLATAVTAAPGANPAAVARNLARNISAEGQALNEQAAILRAGEQATARGEMGGVLAGARNADIGLATSQAGFQQQTSLEQAKLSQQTQLANLESQRQIALAQGNADLATNLQDQMAQLEAQTTQAGLDTQVNLEQARLAQQTELANLENRRLLAIQQGDMDLAAQIQNQQTQLQTTIAQAEFEQQAGLTTAGFQQETALANQQAQLENQAQINELTAFYTAQGLSIDAAQFAAQQEMERLQFEAHTAPQVINAQTASQNAATRGQLAGGIIGGIGAGVGALALSDRTAKKNISGPEGRKAIREMLEKLHPYAFEYKEPGAPGATEGRLVGVMAQDLQLSSEGKKMVNEGPGGLKVDVVKALSAVLAAAADSHHRLEALENPGEAA